MNVSLKPQNTKKSFNTSKSFRYTITSKDFGEYCSINSLEKTLELSTLLTEFNAFWNLLFLDRVNVKVLF